MFDLFAGGAVHRMAIFALNLIPYITASIVVQVITTASPRLEALKKEGEAGRRKINQYTRYLAVVFCAIQAYGIAIGLEGSQGVVLNPGWFFRISTVVTLVGGTMFLMWLGEQITSRGVGNGISLIIFAGIVANLPTTIVQTLELSRTGALPGFWAIGLPVLAHRRHRRHRVLRARPATAADPVSKAPGRQQDVPGRHLAPAAEAQHLGRYPGDLRLVAAAAAGDDRVVRRARRCAAVADQSRRRCSAAASRSIWCCSPSLIIFFSFFYTSIVLQPDRHRRQPEALGRLHSGHPAGRADGPAHRLRADPHHRDRRALPDGRGADPRDDPQPAQRQPVHRRHVAAHHGDGDARHHQPDPEPPHRAAI